MRIQHENARFDKSGLKRLALLSKKINLCVWYVSTKWRLWMAIAQRRTQGGILGLKPPLEHDFLQNFITDAKDIKRFRILFAC